MAEQTTARKRTDVDRIISMLERRERTAKAANDEARDARDAYVMNGGDLDTAQYSSLRMAHNRASSRWTEAQEALSAARVIAG